MLRTSYDPETMPIRLLRIGMLALLVAAARAQAPAWQSAAGGTMAFEVASIRVTEPGKFSPPSFALSSDDSMRPTGGEFHADFPLIVYIEFAYKIWPSRDQTAAMLAQMPKWATTEHFTIHAKAAGNPSKDQYRLMVQALLAERFKLAVHFENREVAALAMTLEKPGKLGPNLRPHSEGPACDPAAAMFGSAVFPGQCGSYSARPSKNGMWLNGSRDTTMELLANFVAMSADQGRPVVDRTGLTGRYDFTLEFVADTHGPAAATATDAEGPTFLEALHDQLGLKLAPIRATVQVLAIDHVEQPTEN